MAERRITIRTRWVKSGPGEWKLELSGAVIPPQWSLTAPRCPAPPDLGGPTGSFDVELILRPIPGVWPAVLRVVYGVVRVARRFWTAATKISEPVHARLSTGPADEAEMEAEAEYARTHPGRWEWKGRDSLLWSWWWTTPWLSCSLWVEPLSWRIGWALNQSGIHNWYLPCLRLQVIRRRGAWQDRRRPILNGERLWLYVGPTTLTVGVELLTERLMPRTAWSQYDPLMGGRTMKPKDEVAAWSRRHRWRFWTWEWHVATALYLPGVEATAWWLYRD